MISWKGGLWKVSKYVGTGDQKMDGCQMFGTEVKG